MHFEMALQNFSLCIGLCQNGIMCVVTNRTSGVYKSDDFIRTPKRNGLKKTVQVRSSGIPVPRERSNVGCNCDIHCVMVSRHNQKKALFFFQKRVSDVRIYRMHKYTAGKITCKKTKVHSRISKQSKVL